METKSVAIWEIAVEQYDPTVFVLAVVPAAVLILIALIYMALAFKKRWAEKQLLRQYETDAPEPVLSVATTSAVVVKLAPENVRPPELSWVDLIRAALAKTRDSLTSSISSLFSGGALSEEILKKLHEVLYRSDLGVKATDRLIARVKKNLAESNDVKWPDVRDCLRDEIKKIFYESAVPAAVATLPRPCVILIVGVNGAGKTTSIGKLAGYYSGLGKSVLLCAGDTFRAAAIDQLQVWADRVGVDLVKHSAGSDPAAVAYDGVKAAKARGIDVVLIDTAGRLQAKETLMEELAKIRRVISKEIADAPHECWLVLDATTGQNAVSQLKIFQEVAKVSGLIVTKLDGTAKGGVLVGLIEQFKVPIRFIGVGEKVNDLRDFDSDAFTNSLLQ